MTPADIFAADNQRIAYQRALRDNFSVVDYIQSFGEKVDMKVFGKAFLKNLKNGPDYKLAAKGLSPKNVKKAAANVKKMHESNEIHPTSTETQGRNPVLKDSHGRFMASADPDDEDSYNHLLREKEREEDEFYNKLYGLTNK